MKMWYIYTMGVYPAVKTNDKIMKFSANWRLGKDYLE